MNTVSYVLELEKGVWLAPWEGNPGRTTNKEDATIFAKVEKAMMALVIVKTIRPFKKAEILRY